MGRINKVYRDAIAYLSALPAAKFDSEVLDAWGNPYNHKAGCLFRLCWPTEELRIRPSDVGCLTMVRGDMSSWKAATPQLTAAILADKSLPKNRADITVKDLPKLGRWQTRMDRYFKKGGLTNSAVKV